MAGKKMNYSKKRLLRALEAVKEGKYKICEAAKIYQIPRQTLSDKIKGRRPPGYCKPGPQAVLGADVESKLETWLLENFKRGFPLSREGVEFSVKHIVDQIPESARSSIPFKNNTPGKGWFKSFRKRHPQVALQYFESARANKSSPTEDDLKQWYGSVELLLEEKTCTDLIQDPSRIWVMNELIVAVGQQDCKLSLLDRKKSQKIATKAYSDDTYTIFLTANALGKLAPPLIITKNSQIFDHLAEMVYGKWGALLSESCLLTSETFYDYVTKVLYPHLIQNNVVFPIVIFVNEDFLCTSLPLTEFCQTNDIILLGMPRNATNFMNPLNAAFGFPLKMVKKYDPVRGSNTIEISHPVVSLVEDLLANDEIEKYIIDQFCSCNIYPFGYDESMYNEEIPMLAGYLENKLPTTVVRRFQTCKAKNIPWNGPNKYLALYEFWLKICDESISNESCDDDEISSQTSENYDAYIIEEEIELC